MKNSGVQHGNIIYFNVQSASALSLLITRVKRVCISITLFIYSLMNVNSTMLWPTFCRSLRHAPMNIRQPRAIFTDSKWINKSVTLNTLNNGSTDVCICPTLKCLHGLLFDMFFTFFVISHLNICSVSVYCYFKRFFSFGKFIFIASIFCSRWTWY